VKATRTFNDWSHGDLVKRYAKFCLVGGSGVLVDMGVIYLLASPSMFHWNISLSKVLAAEAAVFNNFVWNDLWTFRETRAAKGRSDHWIVRLIKFNLICVAGIGLSVLLLNVQVHWLGMNLYVANLIAIALVSVWNFFLNMRFAWSSSKYLRVRTAGGASQAHDKLARIDRQ